MGKLAVCGAAGLACAACAADVNVGERISGFVVRSVENLPDVGGRLVQMVYEANGAELAWLDRDEDNMTFAIAFRTIPSDDTGVAHIIEHSVLCGSEKYPVKEPFVDLLKSSFATFLNAYTATDHTAYPVSSRNGKDFLNLIDVYLDAVLHPLSVKSPDAFRQEGWHWELSEDGSELGRNGIVYSEMKGVLAKPLAIAETEVNKLLYPDTAYRFNAGGDPEHIPELTYKGYCDFYRRHYHPSNAHVFLDGRVDLAAVLARLDAAFAPFPKRERVPQVPFQAPRRAERTVPYPLAPGQDAKDRTILSDAFLVAKATEVERVAAMEILADAIAGSNEAPLTKALLEQGFCDDVTLSQECAMQAAAILTVENAADGKADEIRALVRSTLESLASSGLDHARLEAVISRKEFEYREQDFGTYPRGLAYHSAFLGQWLYGGDPAAAFKLNDVFKSLRKKVSEGWFERFLREALVDNPSHVSLTLVPDASLAERRLAEDKASLARTKASWSEADLARVRDEFKSLKAFQDSPDSPEDTAKLPKLGIVDIPENGPVPEYALEDAPGGAKLCRAKTQAKGIVYATLAFPLEGLSPDELADAAFAAELFGELDTAKRSVADLKNDIDSRLGRFSATVAVFGENAGSATPGRGRAYLLVKAAALESMSGAITEIVGETLKTTKFVDTARVGDALTQRRTSMEQSADGYGGMRFARTRAGASVHEAGALAEYTSGLAAMRRMQKLDDSFGKDGEKTCAAFADLMGRIVAGGAEALFVSDNADREWAAGLLAAFPRGNAPGSAKAPLLPARREGFTSGGSVASVAKASFVPSDHGTAIVASRLLTLDYLWTEVRVRGGAYGGSLTRSNAGIAMFLSWNDPTPARTVGVYDGSGNSLRKAAGEDFEKYVVSAVASTEPYLTPSAEMGLAVATVLSRRTPEDLQRTRRAMLSATRAGLLRFADELDRAASSRSVCVIGGKAPVDACREFLDSVEDIAAHGEREDQ